MRFHTKVPSRFVTLPGLKLEVRFEVPPEGTAAAGKVEETKTALRELGLREDFEPD